MRLLPLLVLLCLTAFPATAQHFGLTEDSVRPCGFRSPNIAAARWYLRTNFDTLRFQPGERIADVGTQSGNLAGLLALFYDDLDLTLEDIDSACLNPAQLRAVMRYYYRMRERPWPQRLRTHLVIGTETSTTLPDAAYGTVFFLNTFHEVAAKDAVLADLYRITAPGGTLYVSERVSTTKHLRRHDCGHGMPLERELLQAFSDAGFVLAGTRETDRYRQKRDWVRHCCYRFRKG